MVKAPPAVPFRLSVLVPVYNERFLVEACLGRVLAFRHPAVSELEVIVVDDGSTDGTRAILERLAAAHPEIRYFPQDQNRGKGAAVQLAITKATGWLSVIQDADLEYHPDDWGPMIAPFLEAGADAVFGSRYLPAQYRRVLSYSHTAGNRLITNLSNLFTDLSLTDVETCLKMVRTSMLASIPIRGRSFTIEPELTAKLAKRGAVIYEVPIRYAGRTAREGKKIKPFDGLLALGAILRWWVEDDLYVEDDQATRVRMPLNHVQRFDTWMADTLAPWVGSRVLELGAGVGNITLGLLPRDRYVATDIHPQHLDFLQNLAAARPQLEIRRLALDDSAAFAELSGQFDTVLCVNVLEHAANDQQAIANLASALCPGGRLVLLVPRGPELHGTLDTALGHTRRYDDAALREMVEAAGLTVVHEADFNRAGAPGWYLNGRVLRRERFSRVQLKLFNTAVPLLRHVDAHLPLPGLSRIVVAERG